MQDASLIFVLPRLKWTQLSKIGSKSGWERLSANTHSILHFHCVFVSKHRLGRFKKLTSGSQGVDGMCAFFKIPRKPKPGFISMT